METPRRYACMAHGLCTKPDCKFQHYAIYGVAPHQVVRMCRSSDPHTWDALEAVMCRPAPGMTPNTLAQCHNMGCTKVHHQIHQDGSFTLTVGRNWCRFGDACRTELCPFWHPRDAAFNVLPAGYAGFCWHGSRCDRRHPDCAHRYHRGDHVVAAVAPVVVAAPAAHGGAGAAPAQTTTAAALMAAFASPAVRALFAPAPVAAKAAPPAPTWVVEVDEFDADEVDAAAQEWADRCVEESADHEADTLFEECMAAEAVIAAECEEAAEAAELATQQYKAFVAMYNRDVCDMAARLAPIMAYQMVAGRF